MFHVSSRVMPLVLSLLILAAVFIPNRAESGCNDKCRNAYMFQLCSNKKCVVYVRTDCRVCAGFFGPFLCNENTPTGNSCVNQNPGMERNTWDVWEGCTKVCDCDPGIAKVEANTTEGEWFGSYTHDRMICN